MTPINLKRPWCWERLRARGEGGVTEDETVGWHHWLNGHEFEQTPGHGEGQENLTCCSPWGGRVGHDWATEQQPLRRLHLQKRLCSRVLAVRASTYELWDWIIQASNLPRHQPQPLLLCPLLPQPLLPLRCLPRALLSKHPCSQGSETFLFPGELAPRHVPFTLPSLLYFSSGEDHFCINSISRRL